MLKVERTPPPKKEGNANDKSPQNNPKGRGNYRLHFKQSHRGGNRTNNRGRTRHCQGGNKYAAALR